MGRLVSVLESANLQREAQLVKDNITTRISEPNFKAIKVPVPSKVCNSGKILVYSFLHTYCENALNINALNIIHSVFKKHLEQFKSC